MNTFMNSLIRQQFLIRYGHYVSDDLIKRLTPEGLNFNSLMKDIIEPNRKADVDDMAENDMNNSHLVVGRIRELTTNYVGFQSVFTPEEWSEIWEEVVLSEAPNFTELTVEKKVA